MPPPSFGAEGRKRPAVPHGAEGLAEYYEEQLASTHEALELLQQQYQCLEDEKETLQATLSAQAAHLQQHVEGGQLQAPGLGSSAQEALLQAQAAHAAVQGIVDAVTVLASRLDAAGATLEVVETFENVALETKNTYELTGGVVAVAQRLCDEVGQEDVRAAAAGEQAQAALQEAQRELTRLEAELAASREREERLGHELAAAQVLFAGMESEVVGLQQAQALAAAKMQLSHEELQRSRQLMEEARRELEGQPANDHAVGVLATAVSKLDGHLATLLEVVQDVVAPPGGVAAQQHPRPQIPGAGATPESGTAPLTLLEDATSRSMEQLQDTITALIAQLKAKDEELWAARTAASFLEERSRANSRSQPSHEGSRADHPVSTRDQPTSSADAAAAAEQYDTSHHHEEPPSPSWSGSDDGAPGDKDAEVFGRGGGSSRPSPVFVQRLSARNQALQSPDAKPGAQSTLQMALVAAEREVLSLRSQLSHRQQHIKLLEQRLLEQSQDLAAMLNRGDPARVASPFGSRLGSMSGLSRESDSSLPVGPGGTEVLRPQEAWDFSGAVNAAAANLAAQMHRQRSSSTPTRHGSSVQGRQARRSNSITGDAGGGSILSSDAARAALASAHTASAVPPDDAPDVQPPAAEPTAAPMQHQPPSGSPPAPRITMEDLPEPEGFNHRPSGPDQSAPLAAAGTRGLTSTSIPDVPPPSYDEVVDPTCESQWTSTFPGTFDARLSGGGASQSTPTVSPGHGAATHDSGEQVASPFGYSTGRNLGEALRRRISLDKEGAHGGEGGADRQEEMEDLKQQLDEALRQLSATQAQLAVVMSDAETKGSIIAQYRTDLQALQAAAGSLSLAGFGSVLSSYSSAAEDTARGARATSSSDGQPALGPALLGASRQLTSASTNAASRSPALALNPLFTREIVSENISNTSGRVAGGNEAARHVSGGGEQGRAGEDQGLELSRRRWGDRDAEAPSSPTVHRNALFDDPKDEGQTGGSPYQQYGREADGEDSPASYSNDHQLALPQQATAGSAPQNSALAVTAADAAGLPTLVSAVELQALRAQVEELQRTNAQLQRSLNAMTTAPNPFAAAPSSGAVPAGSPPLSAGLLPLPGLASPASPPPTHHGPPSPRASLPAPSPASTIGTPVRTPAASASAATGRALPAMTPTRSFPRYSHAGATAAAAAGSPSAFSVGGASVGGASLGGASVGGASVGGAFGGPPLPPRHSHDGRWVYAASVVSDLASEASQQRVMELEEEILTERNSFADSLVVLKRANRELEAKVRELKLELSLKSQQLKQLQDVRKSPFRRSEHNMMADLQTTVTGLTAELSAKDTTIRALEGRVEDLEQAQSRSTRLVSMEVNGYKQQLEMAAEEVEAMRKSLVEAEEAFNEVQAAQLRAETRVQDLEVELAELRSKGVEAEEAFGEVQAVQLRAEARLQHLELELAELRSNGVEAEEAFGEAQAAQLRAETRVQQLELELSELRSKGLEVEEGFRAAAEALAAAKAETEAERERAEALGGKLEEAQHTLDQVQLEVSSLRHQLNAVEEERSRMSAAALHLDKAHTAEEAQHRARMEELCQAVAEAELLTMQLRQQLAETQDQLIQKAERLAFEEARAAGLGAGLQAADQQLQELQMERASLEGAASASLTAAKAEGQLAVRQREELIRERDDAQKRVVELKRQLQEAAEHAREHESQHLLRLAAAEASLSTTTAHNKQLMDQLRAIAESIGVAFAAPAPASSVGSDAPPSPALSTAMSHGLRSVSSTPVPSLRRFTELRSTASTSDGGADGQAAARSVEQEGLGLPESMADTIAAKLQQLKDQAAVAEHTAAAHSDSAAVLQEQLREATEQLRAATEQVVVLQERLQATEAGKAALEQQLADAEAARDALEARLGHAEVGVDQLRLSTEGKLAGLQEQLSEATHGLQHANQQVEQAQAAAEELQQRLAHAEGRAWEAEQQLRSLQAERDGLVAGVEGLTAECERLSADCERRSGELEAARAAHAEEQAQLEDRLRRDGSEARDVLAAEALELRKTVSRLEGELAASKAEHGEALKKVEEVLLSEAALQEQLEAFKAAEKLALQEFSSTTAAAQALQDELETTREQQREADAESEQQRARLAAAEAELQKVEEQMDALQAAIAQAEEQAKQLRGELAAVQDSLAVARRERDEAVDAAQQLAAAQRQQEQRVEGALQKHLEAVRQELELSREQLQRTEEERDAAEVRLAAVQEVLDALGDSAGDGGEGEEEGQARHPRGSASGRDVARSPSQRARASSSTLPSSALPGQDLATRLGAHLKAAQRQVAELRQREAEAQEDSERRCKAQAQRDEAERELRAARVLLDQAEAGRVLLQQQLEPLEAHALELARQAEAMQQELGRAEERMVRVDEDACQRVGELEGRLEVAVAELQAVGVARDRVMEQLEGMAGELEAEKAAREAEAAKAAEAGGRLREVEQLLQELQQQVGELQGQLRAAEERAAEEVAARVKLEADLMGTALQAEAMGQARDAVLQELGVLRGRLAEASAGQAEASERGRALDRLKQQVEQLREQLSAAETRTLAERGQVHSARAQAATLRAELAAVQVEREGVAQQLAMVRAELAAVREERDIGARQLAAAAGDVGRLEEHAAAQGQRVGQLQRQVEALAGELRAAEAGAVEAQAALQQRLAVAEAELAAVKATGGMVEEQVGELQGELAGVRKEVAVATRELVEQQAAAEAQLGELQVKLALAQAQVAERGEHAEALQQQLRQAESALDGARRQLRERDEDARSLVAGLEAALQATRTALEAEAARNKLKVQELQRSLSSSQQQVKQLQDELAKVATAREADTASGPLGEVALMQEELASLRRSLREAREAHAAHKAALESERRAAAAHQARVRELTAQAAEARDAEAEARRALTQAAEQQRAEAASRLVSLQRAAEGASRAADSEVAALRGQLRDEQERSLALEARLAQLTALVAELQAQLKSAGVTEKTTAPEAAPLHSTPPPAPSTTAPLPAASPSGKSAALQAQLVEEASRLRQEVLADTRRLQQLQAKQAAGDTLTSVEAAEQQLLRDRLVAHHTRITNIMAMVGQLQQQRQQRERSREREQPRQATTPQPPPQQQRQSSASASAKRASSASLLRGYELESRAEPAELPAPPPAQYAQRSAGLPKVETPLSKLWADLERGVLGSGSAATVGRDQQGGTGPDHKRNQVVADEADSYLTPTSATAAEQQRQSHSHSQISSVSRRRRVVGDSSGGVEGGNSSYAADLYAHRRDTNSTLSPRLRSPVSTPAVSTVGGAASSTQGGPSAMTATSPPWYPPGTRPQRSVSPPPDRTATTTASRRATSPGGSYLSGSTTPSPYRTRAGGSSYHGGTTPAATEPSRSPYRASVRRTAAGHSEHASDAGAVGGTGSSTPNGSRYRTPYLTMLQDMTYLQYGGGTATAAAAGSDGGFSIAGATAGGHSSASSRQHTTQQRREQQQAQQGQGGTIRLVGGTPAGQGSGVAAGGGGTVLFASPRALNILGASVGQPYVDPPGPVFMPSGVGPAATSPRA